MKQLLIYSMLRKEMFRYCFIFVVVLFALKTNAIEVDNLYTAKVVVNSHSLSDRKQGLKNALRVVFMKIGGKKINHPLFSQAIKNYNQYVNQYRYLDSHLPNKSNVSGENTIYLNVSFNEKKIKSLFKQSDLAIWGRLRPQVMVWVVQENGFDRELISSTSNSLIPTTMTEFSQLRGLPLVMPIMDLTDLSALNLTDVWGRFSKPVAQASMRYLAEAVVIIRISNSSLIAEQGENVNCQPLCKINSFALDWSLMTDSQKGHSQIFSELYQGDDVSVILNQALSDITDIIYQKYALSTSNSNELYIDVINIKTLKDLIELTNFLEELSAIESVQLVSANGENRRFKLSLIGSPETLLEALRLSKLLNQYIEPAFSQEKTDTATMFYWGRK